MATPRLSKLFLPTIKESPPGLSTSFALLLRGGIIRQSASGMYSFLPFGLRILNKIERIIDEEMEAVGGQKLSLPCILSADAWKRTGRWESTEMFKLKDRKESEFCLAPTHEEEITSLVANEISTSRQLPLRLYQIGRKYRDEIKPRTGLLRAREFIMKDMYSFDQDASSALETYETVKQAYTRIFDRIDVPYKVAEADSGSIGGDKSHEFHYVSNVGEDTVLVCPSCSYTANEERAITHPSTFTNKPSIDTNPSTIASPCGTTSLHQQSQLNQELLNKLQLIYSNQHDNDYYKPLLTTSNLDIVIVHLPERQQTIAIAYQPGRKPNPQKLKTFFKGHKQIDIIPTKQILEDPETYLPPSKLIYDQSTLTPSSHDFHTVEPGDSCPTCQTPLQTSKAIEIAHTFYLGTKYSKPLQCEINNSTPVEMGCYGIGVSRLLAAIIESGHGADSKGMKWPFWIAPYKAVVIPLGNPKQVDEWNRVWGVTMDIYNALTTSNDILSDSNTKTFREAFKNDIVIDDRMDHHAGYKLKDAELVGYPFLIIIGKTFLKNGLIEVRCRITGRVWEVEGVKGVVELLKSLKL